MALDSHLTELEKRHQALEKEIEDAMAHPGADDLEISDLKKQKLRLKDEISRLKTDSIH